MVRQFVHYKQTVLGTYNYIVSTIFPTHPFNVLYCLIIYASLIIYARSKMLLKQIIQPNLNACIKHPSVGKIALRHQRIRNGIGLIPVQKLVSKSYKQCTLKRLRKYVCQHLSRRHIFYSNFFASYSI